MFYDPKPVSTVKIAIVANVNVIIRLIFQRLYYQKNYTNEMSKQIILKWPSLIHK
jgi:hypothetical protein